MLKSNPSFTNRFVVIEIPQTNKKETLEIFEGIKDKLENKYSLTIEKDAINEIIDLSDRFLKWRFFPGKAFEVFKEIIAIRKSLLQGTLGKDKESSKELSEISSEKITKNDVFLYLKHKTGLPASIVHPSATLRKKEVTDYFKARVLGQDDAIEALVYTILNFKSEINDDNKPLGVFLFVGPTGVGKTKLARTLAQYLFGSEDRLLRYDMSEYSVPQSVNRLIGVHGYNWERGKLIEDIVANPFSVILLDEIEKAHPNIYNLLLQVFGEGRLTDSCETTVNFQNSIIIMTSNLGSHLYFKKKIGITNFESDEGLFKKQDVVKFVENFFSPEFFNRLTDIICFNQLSKEIMRKIAKMNLEELLSRDGIKKRNLKIKYSDDILDFLVEKGYNEKYGARPMKRAIEKFVGNKISEAIASQEIKLGEEVSISIDSSKKGIKVISKRNFN
jgi:ATP-dependent Clp protease ATP-binding subunit ClpC